MSILGLPDMTMIALAGLIVGAHHAFAGDNQSQSILEAMGRTASRMGKPPHYKLRKSISCQYVSFTEQQLCLHVGSYDNTPVAVNLSNTDGVAANAASARS